uniref:Uncharacterized protein n=1 Tax=Anguilla anguilla TaxID=7936 RepID=A0A0E9UVX7_ANGAN
MLWIESSHLNRKHHCMCLAKQVTLETSPLISHRCMV